jgi:hypothetical protein
MVRLWTAHRRGARGSRGRRPLHLRVTRTSAIVGEDGHATIFSSGIPVSVVKSAQDLQMNVCEFVWFV